MHIMAPVNTTSCEKIYWGTAVPCPWIGQYVHPVKCEKCTHGKAGNFKEKWTLCNFAFSTKQRKEGTAK